jgi:large subunit ribosomal protein L30
VARTLRVTLTKSRIGLSPKQDATVKALGLRRLNQSATHEDSATIRGMVAKVSHVLRVTHEA